MITFKSAGPGHSYKTPLGAVSVWRGIADGKISYVLKIVRDDGAEKHDILLSEEAALAIAALIQLAADMPVAPLQINLNTEGA